MLIDSEQVWSEARRELVEERGGRWHDRAQQEMMGMSSIEWSRYMSERLGVDLPPERISEEVSRGKPAPDVYIEVARRLGVFRTAPFRQARKPWQRRLASSAPLTSSRRS